MQAVTGLRERKKSQTRVVIAETAAELFRRHGFDAVTVESVAQAAGVSKKTVFNYFPTKEDLVFDRTEDRLSGLLAAVTERDEQTTVLESFRTLVLAQSNQLSRLRDEMADGSDGFLDLVRRNPSLQRRIHEINADLTRQLAAALAAEAGTPADDPLVLVVAGTLIGAQRAMYLRLRELAARPTSDAWVVRQHRRDTNRIFDQLRDGLSTFPS
ncbi:MAG TPA: TetR family transcriptional regulator [Mycobacteriales bacterium]|jgi:AcrR family transcriptional regulator|nr:TetR family transcriptional regulator [Mycobacteriales bacterium]